MDLEDILYLKYKTEYCWREKIYICIDDKLA